MTTQAFIATLAVALAAAPSHTAAAGAFPTDPTGPSGLDPIVGGVSTEGDFDAVVALEIDDRGNCSGTLVSPRIVLTAAHCFSADRDDEPVEVFFGPDTSGAPVVAASYGVHPQYCAFCGELYGSEYVERYDFAYVELSEPYTPTDGFLLPLTDQQEWDYTMELGSKVTLVGYGKTDPNGSLASDRPKNKVTTVIEGFSEHGLEFFAGQEEAVRDTCGGDSGGPAIVELGGGVRRLAGVTSRGSDPCGSGGWYGVSFAALSWLDLSAGTELMPVGCEAGECLDITPAKEPATACAVGSRPVDETRLLAALFTGLLLGFRRRREGRGPAAERVRP